MDYKKRIEDKRDSAIERFRRNNVLFHAIHAGEQQRLSEHAGMYEIPAGLAHQQLYANYNRKRAEAEIRVLSELLDISPAVTAHELDQMRIETFRKGEEQADKVFSV